MRRARSHPQTGESPAMRTAILSLALCATATAQTIEDFEHGNEALYTTIGGADTMDFLAAAAHDGALGAQFTSGAGPSWVLRTDLSTSPGNTYECFVRLRGGAAGIGRTYIGVGGSLGGTWSAVFAPNTSEIQLQNNTGFSFSTAAAATATIAPDVWYVLRLDWAANGDMTVELLDESATSVLATTGPATTGFTTPGGLALRGFSTGATSFLDVDTFGRAVAGGPPIVYCSSGTSTNGCVPSISASAQPSASGATACVISIANVEGQKSGMIFYGLDNGGFSPLPWSPVSTSFFCVKSPVQRSFPQSSGGTNGQCDGQISLDWNAFHMLLPGALGAPFSVGDKVYAQGWYRDPPAPRTTNLSDAVELTHVP